MAKRREAAESELRLPDLVLVFDPNPLHVLCTRSRIRSTTAGGRRAFATLARFCRMAGSKRASRLTSAGDVQQTESWSLSRAAPGQLGGEHSGSQTDTWTFSTQYTLHSSNCFHNARQP